MNFVEKKKCKVQASVCVIDRVGVCVFVRERERLCVCVWMCVCERERKRVCKCVYFCILQIVSMTSDDDRHYFFHENRQSGISLYHLSRSTIELKQSNWTSIIIKAIER